jgi:hypothetical protein
MSLIQKLICFLLCPLMAVSTIQGATILALSTEYIDVHNAVGSAVDGDTVVVPPGTSYWTNALDITKMITMRAAGTNSSGVWLTRIYEANPLYNPTPFVGELITIKIRSKTNDPTKVLWITGFDFQQGTSNLPPTSVNGAKGTITILSSMNETNNALFRISGNRFYAFRNRHLYISARAGLVDHNLFEFRNGQTGNVIDWRPTDGYGDMSWTQTVRTGTEDEGVFFENNVFKYPSGTTIACIDGFTGARYVSRFNANTNTTWGGHGTESTGRYRGTRWRAHYGNRMVLTGSGSEYCHLFRSGSGVVFSNVVVGNWPGFCRFVNYRSIVPFSPWMGAFGRNGWDEADESGPFESGILSQAPTTVVVSGKTRQVLTDSTKTWTTNQWVGFSVASTTRSTRGGIIVGNTTTNLTMMEPADFGMLLFTNGEPYEITKVVRALDQPGAGNGTTVISGSTPTPIVNDQVTEPIWLWANTGSKTNLSSAGFYHIRNGVHYTNAVHPTYVPFAYPHYLIAQTEGTSSAPSILSHPASQTIQSGQAATISVSAAGSAPISYQWFFGVSGDTDEPVSGAVSSSYTTPTLTQSSNYWCMVSNSIGTVNSATAFITVEAPVIPPTITAQPQSDNIGSGQTALLTVTASGTSPFSYQWYVGSSGTTTSPIGGATGASYTTPVLSATTSYWVRVTNSAGSADSDTALITVTTVPPGPFSPSSTRGGLKKRRL